MADPSKLLQESAEIQALNGGLTVNDLLAAASRSDMTGMTYSELLLKLQQDLVPTSGINGVPVGLGSASIPNGSALNYSTQEKAFVAATDVNSFNGRTGAVVPANGDYSISQISGVSENVNSSVTIGPVKIVWGTWANQGPFAASGALQTYAIGAAAMGLTTVYGGWMQAWPLATWAGFTPVASGQPVSNTLQGTIYNTGTAQFFNVNYIAAGAA